MKFILVIFLCLPFMAFGSIDTIPSTARLQTVNVDSITIPTSTLLKAGERIQNQQDTINRQRGILNELMTQNNLQTVMLQKQNDELTLLYTRVEISDGIVDRYKDLIRREQWYEKTWIHVTAGFVGALAVSIIVNNIK